MKKILIFLLLVSQIGNAQNLFARQNFAHQNKGFNTEIGGVASTIPTSTDLATKLGISVTRIKNFTVVDSDVKCRIIGSYDMPAASFYFNTDITYYHDIDGLVTFSSNFRGCSNLSGRLEFKGVVNKANIDYYVNGTQINEVVFPNLIIWNYNDFFRNPPSGCIFYIPRVTNLGDLPSQGFNSGTIGFDSTNTIYANPYLATSNAGAEEGDIAYARSQGCTIRYVTNFDAPNPVTDLAAGITLTTSIQLNFTAPTGSTNAIDYYEVWLNGVDSGKTVTASGQNVTGLTTATAYYIELIAVDIFYNKSAKSNKITVSTL